MAVRQTTNIPSVPIRTPMYDANGNIASPWIGFLQAAATPPTQVYVTVNVMDAPYSATGDGVTDDAQAIQAAINFVGAAGGGLVDIPAGSYLITADLYVNYDYVWLRGAGSATVILAGAANLKLIHWCGSRGGIDQGIQLNANRWTGCTGLRISPLDETQLTTVVNQNFNSFYNVQTASCDEGLVLMCGPTAHTVDSGCYYNRFFSMESLGCIRGVWLKDGTGNSGNNRNSWFGLRAGQGASNTGVQIDSGGTNKFFAPSFEGIQSATSPNAVPTAILVAKASAVGADNSDNHFFGLTIEGCTRTVACYNRDTQFYGGGLLFGTTVFAAFGADVVYGGTGYTSVPTVGVSGGGAGAVLPTFAAVLSGSRVASITLLTAGSLLSEPPVLTITGGGGTGALALCLLTLPRVAIGDDPSEFPLMLPGMIYPEGSLGSANPTLQNVWNMYKGMYWPLQLSDQLRVGGDLAGTFGQGKVVTIAAPNDNWGVALLLVCDAIGRGLYLSDHDFSTGVAGKSLGLSLNQLAVTSSGANVAGPFEILSSTLAIDCLSASMPVQTDASKNLISGLIPTTGGGTGLSYSTFADLAGGLLSTVTAGGDLSGTYPNPTVTSSGAVIANLQAQINTLSAGKANLGAATSSAGTPAHTHTQN